MRRLLDSDANDLLILRLSKDPKLIESVGALEQRSQNTRLETLRKLEAALSSPSISNEELAALHLLIELLQKDHAKGEAAQESASSLEEAVDAPVSENGEDETR